MYYKNENFKSTQSETDWVSILVKSFLYLFTQCICLTNIAYAETIMYMTFSPQADLGIERNKIS